MTTKKRKVAWRDRIRTLSTYAVYDPHGREIWATHATKKDAVADAKAWSIPTIGVGPCIVVRLQGTYAFPSGRAD